MRTLFLFMMVSLDGYFEGPDHDISWHNADNDEFQKFCAEQNPQADAILMGHRTYDLMASFWPTQKAIELDPETARFMTDTRKYVVSHRPFDPGWKNATVMTGDVAGQVRALKAQPGKGIALFGSNTLLGGLMKEGLVDEYRIMVNPVVIGKGTPVFAGIAERANLKLKKVRQFASGNVLLTYSNG